MSETVHPVRPSPTPSVSLGELLEVSPDPVVVCSADGQVVAATERFSALLGRPFWETKGLPFASLVHPQDEEAITALLCSPSISPDPARRSACRLIAASGYAIAVDLSVGIWPRSDGALFSVISIREQDPSEAPAHAQVAAAETPSYTSTHAFFMFLNSQFRRAINQIANDTRLVAESQVPPEARQVVGRIVASTEALTHLINLVVEQWMIEAGTMRPAAIDFDLRTMLGNVREALEQIARETGNELRARVDPGLASSLRGDPSRLRQVIIGLGGFLMRKLHGEVIEWHCTPGAESERQLTLDIAFEAMPERVEAESLKKAFEMGGLEVGPEGELLELGLGPYHSRLLAGVLGGDAGWETRSDALVLWARVTLEKQGERGSEAATCTRERVLVASSSPKEVETMVGALREKGWEARGAASQAEALEILREAQEIGRPYGLLLVTLVLPDGSAEQLALQAFSIAGQGKVCVALLADIGRPGDAEWARRVGFSAYLVRPLNTETIHSVLVEMARHVRTPRARGIFLTRHSLAEKKRPCLWVLIVDDDPVARLAMAEALRHLGHQVYAAENGEQALQLCDRARFDLIFMDVGMPDQDGDQIAFLLRSRERSLGQPPAAIIGVSGQAGPDIRQRCLASGMNDLVPKPLDLDALAAIIDSMKPAEALLRVWQPPGRQAPGAQTTEISGKPAPPSLAELMGMHSIHEGKQKDTGDQAPSKDEAA